MVNEQITLGKKIQDFRQELNISQRDLAEKIGKTTADIAMWESGEAVPSINEIVKMCSAFNKSTDFFLMDTELPEDIQGKAEKGLQLETGKESNYQSVSRWENSVCYPDMELLPVMADFFGVTVDSLMGVDDVIEKERVSRYLDDFQNAISKGDVHACIEIARKGVNEYPNNYALLNKLMFALFVAGDDDGNIPDWEDNRKKYDGEIIRIGERIMKYCPDLDLRLEATARLAFQHCEMGRKEKGREIYETLPTMEQCREQNIWWALQESERLPFLRNKIKCEYEILRSSIWLLGESGCLSEEESLSVMKKLYDLQNVILDNQSCLDSWGESRIPFVIAEIYLRLNDTASAMKYLTKAAQAAKAFDERPEVQQSNSLLLGDITAKKTDFQTSDTRTLCEIMKESWLQDEIFDLIRESTEFKMIIDSLK